MSKPTEKVARRFEVLGRVQGVGFRYFVQRAAVELGVSGWVRNRPDGSVEAWAEGTEEQVDQMRAVLREGPRISRVDRIEEHPTGAADYDAFRITG